MGAQSKAQPTELLCRHALAASELPLALLDAQSNVLLWSEGLAQLTGRTASEAVDRPIQGLLSGEWRKDWEEFLRLAMDRGLVRNAPIEVASTQGKSRALLVSLRPLRGPELLGFFLAFSLPQEEWKIGGDAAAWEETFLKLQQLSLVGQLAAAFAHDLKSPLHVILSTAEFLKESAAGDVRQNLEMIERNARRASLTTKTLMDIASAGRVQLAPGSLNDLVRRTVELSELSLRGRKIEINQDLAETPPILMDANHLQGVFYNLLANAAEAMPRGGELRVSTSRTREGVVLSIEDGGEGIQPAVLPRLGQPFFSTKPGGTGLGLFLAKRIVREHGAELRIESAPGRGTCVSMVFPAAES